jgi:hypothetical protein
MVRNVFTDPVSIGVVLLLLVIYYDAANSSLRTLVYRPPSVKIATVVALLAGPAVIMYRAAGLVPAAITGVAWSAYNLKGVFSSGI